METTLRRLAISVQTLEKGLVQFQNQARQEQETLTAQAMITNEKMAAMQMELPAQLDGIHPKELQLTAMVKECLDQVHFPQQVEGARSSAMIFFRELAFWAQQTAEHCGGHASTSALADKLKQLHQNYTMAEERDIHESSFMAPSVSGLALAGSMAAPPAENKADAESSSIELFDDFTIPDAPANTAASELSAAGAAENNSLDGADPVGIPPQSAPKGPTDPSNKEPEKIESLGDNVELF
jgi:hypothetical protein